MLVNEGFETGVLVPWTSDEVPVITATMPHSGMWSAQVTGGAYIRQDFAAVPVSQLLAANFWSWHDVTDGPLIVIEWGYSDNTTGNDIAFGDQLDGWVKHDLLGDMNQNKSIVYLIIYGYSGGSMLPDISRFDDFRFCRKP